MLDLVPFFYAANIDLKSFDTKIYKKLNAGTLETVLNTLKILKDNNVWIEITNLIIPTWTDDLLMIKNMCKWLVNNGFSEFPLHFSKFSPLHKLSNLQATKTTVLEQAREIALKQGLKYVLIGNVWGHEAENTFCPNCQKVVIKRTGFAANKINIKDNKCIFCGEKISGIWE